MFIQSLLFAIVLIFVYSTIGKAKSKAKRFAYDAVGEGDDGLNFQSHVDGFIKSLDSLEDCVSVVSLFGDLGHGKSSFLRMAVEKMDANEFLYTYISLTETNEAKDFGQLFAERWRETLSESYPIIDTTSASNMLRPILRDVTKDFFSSVFGFVEQFNRQIIPTEIVFRHTLNKNDDEKYLDKDTAKMFGNVDAFSEKRWIVVIDELERAKREEIFRTIEIIERFKTLGSKGLPIQIVFVICTSEKDLKDLLLENPGEPSKQINDFFFTNPKTFSNYEFIPYPSWEKMIKYIQVSLLKVRKDKRLKSLFDKHEKQSQKLRFPQTTLSQIESDRLNKKLSQEEVIDIVTILMANESPRLVKKVVDDLAFVTLRLSVTSMMSDELLPFPFSHMLLLSFIRVKYPELFVFLHETVDDVFRTTQDKVNENMFKSIVDRDKKTSFEEWFKTVRGNSAQQYNWGLFEKLIAMASYEYLDYLKKEQKDYLEDYINLKYIPYGLLRYLRAIEGLQLPEDADFIVYLKKYQAGKSLKTIVQNSDQLYLIARNSRRLYSLKSEFHVAVSSEILERMVDGRLVIEPREIRDSIYSHLTYEFLFHLNEAVKKTKSNNKKKRLQMIKKVGELLTAFFKSEKISLGSKFILLNSLLKESRSAEIHWELDNLIKEMEDAKVFSVQEIVDLSLNHFKSKYIDSKAVIYENEENYYYVMYQYWTGDKTDEKSISIIRAIAKRGLERFPDVIEQFWDSLPYDESSDIEDIFTDDYLWHHSENLQPYLKVSTLVDKSTKTSITDKELLKKIDYWKRNLIKGEDAYMKVKTLQDGDTLMKALINKGYVEKV